MAVKIVADSSCDLNENLKKILNIQLVPLTLRVGGEEFRDDENLDVKELVQKMKEAPKAPSTACPTPGDFMEAYQGEEDVFVVTLSSQLSGTYESAHLAKKMSLEKVGDQFIHIFDSLSASVGETLVSLKIFELAKEKYEKMQIVEKVNEYIQEMKTFFLLESLDNLIKAGRINVVTAKLASLLHIKPIMGGAEDGTIEVVEKVRGSKRAFRRFIEVIGEKGEQLEEKILGIAHCNCPEKAEKFRVECEKRYNFKDIVVVEMGGLSSIYANDGGLVIAF